MIREYEDSDAEDGSALIAEHSPWFSTAAGTRHRLSSVPPRAHRKLWVAEEAGRIVGWGEAEFDWATEVDDAGGVWVIVHPDHRRRGVGSALFEEGLQHLASHGARELRSWADSESASFLEQRGFVPGRVERLSSLDPSVVDTSRLDERPDGVRVTPVAELLDRLPDVHALYAEAAADMPADNPETNVPLDEWLDETIGNPDLDRELSVVVLVDDVPAALSWVHVDRSRGLADHDLTGTARAYRRRSLARLAKLAVVRGCAEAGISRLMTENDSENAGMLAINDELGFKPYAVMTEWVKRRA
ncbi:MAG: GNAT family N-acetyltransferase [Actinobacteria bacterium]|nr:GNAT family N-acetyltransferase [Actinomycetota bacterium]